MYFSTIEDYNSTINCLEDSYEAWNTAFDNTYDPNLYTVDQWDDYADSIGFNEDAPLVKFESCANFRSLRMYLDSLENEWLNTYNSDSIHDPDLITIIDDDIEQCLFNPYNEIAIGDTIYKFYEDGTVIAIGGLDCNTLDQIRKDPKFRNGQTVAFNPSNSPGGSTCKIWNLKKRGYWYFDGGNRKIFGLHKFMFYPWGSKEIAKTMNYKKKRGKFCKAKGEITVRIDGYRYNLNCNEQVTFSTNKYAFRKKVKTKYSVPGNIWQIKNNENFSTHKVDYWVGPTNNGTFGNLYIWW